MLKEIIIECVFHYILGPVYWLQLVKHMQNLANHNQNHVWRDRQIKSRCSSYLTNTVESWTYWLNTGKDRNNRWHEHFLTFHWGSVSNFRCDEADQRSQWRADIKQISKMKSLYIGVIFTWWGFSYDFDDGRTKEPSVIDGPVTCSHMKRGGSPRSKLHLDRSWKQIKRQLSKPLCWHEIIKRFIEPLICCFDF